MKTLFCLLLFFVKSALSYADEPYHTRCERKLDPSKQTKFLQRVRLSLDSIVFPEVSLSNVSFMDAVGWIQHHNREYTPVAMLTDIGGINFTIMPRQGVKEEFNVSLRSATLPQVLDAICAQHGYIWCLDPYALTIAPRERLTTLSR